MDEATGSHDGSGQSQRDLGQPLLTLPRPVHGYYNCVRTKLKVSRQPALESFLLQLSSQADGFLSASSSDFCSWPSALYFTCTLLQVSKVGASQGHLLVTSQVWYLFCPSLD